MRLARPPAAGARRARSSSSCRPATCEPGEEPLATAQRELREECGLTGGTWQELTAFWTTPGFCREYMHVYLAEGVEAGEAAPEADEELEVVRWPVDELEARLAEIEDAKTLAGCCSSCGCSPPARWLIDNWRRRGEGVHQAVWTTRPVARLYALAPDGAAAMRRVQAPSRGGANYRSVI